MIIKYLPVLYCGFVSAIFLLLINSFSIVQSFVCKEIKSESLFVWLLKSFLIFIIIYSFKRIADNNFNFKPLGYLIWTYLILTIFFIIPQIPLGKMILDDNESFSLMVIVGLLYVISTILILVIYGIFIKYEKLFVVILLLVLASKASIVFYGLNNKYLAYISVANCCVDVVIFLKFIRREKNRIMHVE